MIDIKAARHSLGMTQTKLAEALRMGRHGRRRVRGWENTPPEYNPSGPVVVAIELLCAMTPEDRDRYLLERDSASL